MPHPDPTPALAPLASPRWARCPAPVLALLAAWVAAPPPAAAQPAQPAAAPGPAVAEDLATDVRAAGEKLVALAGAIPAESWDWRPAPGVRSVAEVLEHVASDQLYFPTAVGVEAPAGSGITREYATARAWGDRDRTRDALLAGVEASVEHLRSAILREGPETLGEPVRIFGRSMDRQELWIMATTHLHEHLGQLIAYARMQGIVPPWSREG